MHCAAYHFIKICILSFTQKIHSLQAVDKCKEDIDVSVEIEASSDDVAAMALTTTTNFKPGDVLGKLLVFVNQVRMSSEGFCAYLDHVCAVHQLKAICNYGFGHNGEV